MLYLSKRYKRYKRYTFLSKDTSLHILEYEYRNKQTAQYLLSTDRILEIGL